ARLVNEGREYDGDLRIADGRIAEIGTGLQARAGETVVDAAGRRLLPGMIDDQVHFREPGMEYKADMAVESGAAVAGGLTSFMDMPNTSPPTLDAEALEDKYRRAAGRVRGNYGFYMGTSTTNLEHIQRLDPLTAPGVKVFMGASTGNMLVDDPEVLDAVFRDVPTPIITHCEDTPMIEAATARYKAQYGDDIPAACHPDIRSREACMKSTQLAISLARRHGTRLHVLHISTADELALFEAGPLVRADGSRKQITAETCIHFLRFDPRDYDELGHLTTAQVVQKFAHAPAQLFDVKQRGFLREGYAADLVLIDDTPLTVRRQDVLSKCGWSPFEGRTFHSRIASTWVNGALAWDGTRLVGAPNGQRLEFDR